MTASKKVILKQGIVAKLDSILFKYDSLIGQEKNVCCISYWLHDFVELFTESVGRYSALYLEIVGMLERMECSWEIH